MQTIIVELTDENQKPFQKNLLDMLFKKTVKALLEADLYKRVFGVRSMVKFSDVFEKQSMKSLFLFAWCIANERGIDWRRDNAVVTIQGVPTSKFCIGLGDLLTFPNSKDFSGLHVAALFGMTKMAQDILAYARPGWPKADVNGSDHYGNTPLIYADAIRAEDIVDLLIANGANIDTKNKYGHIASGARVEAERSKRNIEHALGTHIEQGGKKRRAM